jgi:hypothetical protein
MKNQTNSFKAIAPLAPVDTIMKTLNACKLWVFAFLFASPMPAKRIKTHGTSKNELPSDNSYRDSGSAGLDFYSTQLSGFELECELENWLEGDQENFLYEMSTEDNPALH